MTFATEEETTQEQDWTQQIHQQEFQFPKSWRELKVALVPLWASLQTPVGAFAGLLMITVVVSGAILFLVTFLSFDSGSCWSDSAVWNLVHISFSHSHTRPNTKENWLEVNSQILNGCFTLTTILTQPIRALLLYYTILWMWAKDGNKITEI